MGPSSSTAKRLLADGLGAKRDCSSRYLHACGPAMSQHFARWSAGPERQERRVRRVGSRARDPGVRCRGGRDGPRYGGMMTASGRRLPGWRGRREAGLKTPGTDGRGWPAHSIPDLRWKRRLQQMAGQQVEQKMASAEVGRGGPDVPGGDQLEGGGR